MNKKILTIAIDANEANVATRVGSGQYAYHMLTQWSDDPGTIFDLFLKDDPIDDLPESSSNWRYHVIHPSRVWLNLSLPLHLLTHKYNHDVFFAPAHYSPPITNSKLVVTIHDLAYEYYPELFLKKDLYKLKKWTRKSVARASRVIAVSEATKRDVVNLYGADPDKIVVVHNGYDQARFHPKVKINSKALSKYKINQSKYLLYVGTIQPRKNVIKLVQAFHLLKEANAYDGKLVIAGNPGWLSDPSIRSTRTSKYSKDIILTGYIPQDDLPSMYKQADAYILPSLMEGFGIPLLESMAVGTPVAAADNSSLPEVVGTAGELFDPHDSSDIAESIKKLLSSREEYSKKSLKQAIKFSWHKSAIKTLKVLKQVALAK